MEHAVLNEVQLKEIMKTAFIETFEEKRNLLYDLIAEAREDVALVQAIKKGEDSPSVSRAEVFDMLESRA